MYCPGRPIFGAHATSRTQLSWPVICSSSTHFLAVSSKPQMRMTLSDPPDAKRFCAVTEPAGADLLPADGMTEGAHEMALAPEPWALKMTASVEPSSVC